MIHSLAEPAARIELSASEVLNLSWMCLALCNESSFAKELMFAIHDMERDRC